MDAFIPHLTNPVSWCAQTAHAAANDNDPPPAAPAMPVPLAAEFRWVRSVAQAERLVAQAERLNAIAHGSLIIEQRS